MAVIENQTIGGTCVNVGCVPKKVMFNLSTWMEDAHNIQTHQGVQGLSGLKLDYPFFKQARDAYVARLNGIYQKNLEGSGVKYIEGRAEFSGPKSVTVKETSEVYEAEHICIASGGAPKNDGFEGHEHCMNSNDFFAMDKIPKTVTVIGGGYIGVELAQILQGLGS